MNRRCLCARPRAVTDPGMGERVCGTCGVVIESHLAENRLMHETGYGSPGLDDYGIGTLNPASSNKIESMAAQRRKHASRLSRMFVSVGQMLDTVHASQCIRDEAYMLCRKIVCREFIRGQDRIVVAAALVMLACRLHGRILEWSDIPGMGHKRGRAARMCRHIQSLTGFTHSEYTKALINRKCTDMNLSVRRAVRAITILDDMRKARFTDGKKPQCVAAATIVLSGTGTPSKKAVAEAAKISEAGLQKILLAWKDVVQ